MKKTIITIFVIALIVVGVGYATDSYATVSYTRTPSGAEISPPDQVPTIQIILDSFEDLLCGANEPYWNLVTIDINDDWYYSNSWTLASTSLEFNQNLHLPAGSYKEISPICCLDDYCSGFNGAGIWFEGGLGEVIFSVVSGVLPYTYVSASFADVTEIVSYPNAFINDIAPLLALVLGLPAGLWVITRIFGLFPKK